MLRIMTIAEIVIISYIYIYIVRGFIQILEGTFLSARHGVNSTREKLAKTFERMDSFSLIGRSIRYADHGQTRLYRINIACSESYVTRDRMCLCCT